ncbi:MAG TPA: phosphate signaling complex protein PhoU [Chitinophagaceae bacterium]|nr:phosphate signaling complex protein PhoU [Chitinophagaceae bacterium]
MKKNVLFLCVENANRSQMAEAFASMHGADKVAAYSAGSLPSGKINPLAVEAMKEVGYDLQTHRSKSISELPDIEFEYVVSMGCGDNCPHLASKHRLEWNIPDPASLEVDAVRKIRDLIEAQVKELLTNIKGMTHLDTELQMLKSETVSMWNLVALQLNKTRDALFKLDKDLAREIVLNEKRVNAYELKIDRDCENIFALFNPVAVDLRFVLAVLKINSNLERTGDIAEGIGKFIVSTKSAFDTNLLEVAKVSTMFDESMSMLNDVLSAFETENTALARSVFKRDEALDQINISANSIIVDYVKNNPENIEQALYILSTIRKLERVGDQAKNIAEEIIFYVEAKVLKHKKQG